MKTIQIEYPESIPAALNLSPESFEADARLALAVKLFELGRLSSGQAAALAGMPRVTFLLNCHKYAASTVAWDPEEIEEVQCLSSPIEPLLETLLDTGEASVIHLAREEGADFVLIDERKARKIARKIYGINVVGSVRIVVEAKHRCPIANVREALEGMRSAGYWIHDDSMKTALEQAEEG